MTNTPISFVSVIIPVFKDIDCLRYCLQSLHQQTYPRNSYEIIVVDNSPTSDPALFSLLEEFPSIVLVHEPRRGSYAARNYGLSLAQGSMIAFTDADCRPALDWLEKGVGWLTRHPSCGLVAGQIRFFFKHSESPTLAEIYDSLHFLQQKTYVEEYHFGATANLFTFKSRFESVGLFNSNVLSGGDRDWGQRVAAAGYTLLYADDVIIAHPARHSFRDLRTKALRVTIGDHNLSHANDRPFLSFFSEVLPEFKPHFQYAIDRFTDPSIAGWRRKLGCYFIYLSIRYLKAGKRIQLYLSHQWIRYLRPREKRL